MLVTYEEVQTFIGRTTMTDAEKSLLGMIHPMAEAALKTWMQNDLGYVQHIEYYPGGVTGMAADVPLDAYQLDGDYFVAGRSLGGTIIQLKHTPVWTASLEVREDTGAYAGQGSGAFGSDTVLTVGTDYWIDLDDAAAVTASGTTAAISRTGILHRVGAWPTEPRSVKVTYYGGHNAYRLANAAADIKLAALMTVASCYWATAKNADKAATAADWGDVPEWANPPTQTGGWPGVPPAAKSLLWPHRVLTYRR